MIRYFDGGMGSMLNLRAGELPEQLNINEPERVFAVHKAYADVGADIITANTFFSCCHHSTAFTLQT